MQPVRRVAITGASGLIGSALTRRLREDGVTVIRIGRSSSADVQWDFASAFPKAGALEGIDAVVNLAGESLARRWTPARRRAIRESRVRPTEVLAQTLGGLQQRPVVFVSGSAIGVYGDRGDEALTESSELGTDFLAGIARAWEAATSAAENAGIRVVRLRTGVVLSRNGGALAKLLLPFQLGLGGRIGHGRQWMSWIGLNDLVRAIRFLMDSAVAGAVNAVAPTAVTNADFTRALGNVLSRPTILPVPAGALRLAFGEMADGTLLASQRVIPKKLLDAGFTFDDPDVDRALRRALRTETDR